jgi:glycosyltransferase involved in cell wall biosynthesis
VKHVLLINHYAVPPSSTGGTRHYCLAKWLIPHGWQMTIVAAGVNHHSGESYLAPGEVCRVDRSAGVDFVWLKTNSGSHSRQGLSRIIGMLCFAWRVIRLNPAVLPSGPRPNVIIGSSVHPFAALAGWVLACRLHAQFIFEVRDLWPETLVTLGKLRRYSPVVIGLYWIERFLFNRARFIISPLPRVFSYVQDRTGSSVKVRVIPNGIDLQAADAERHSALPIPPSRWRHTVLYIGSMGNGNDLATLLTGFKLFQIANPLMDVGLRLVGEGPFRPALEKLVSAENIHNVEFHSSVPHTAVSSLVSSADLLVITVPNQPELYRFGVCMNKFFDYLASGRPTLSANSAPGDPVDESGGGLNVPSGDAASIADGMFRLLSANEQDRQRMGELGREFVTRKHDFRVIAAELRDVLDAAIQKSN